MTAIRTSLSTFAAERRETLVAAFTALGIGVALVFTTGFAGADMLHNAAHDWRHSMSFPCH